MQRVILTTYKQANYKGAESHTLLTGDDAISIPIMRKAMKEIDFNNALILSTHPKMSKIFKEDYGFNDHGIYYDLKVHPATEEELENCVVVFAEEETKHRDFARWTSFFSFRDPVYDYGITNDWSLYFDGTPETKYILDIETTGLDFTQGELYLLSVKIVGHDEIYICENPTVDQVHKILDDLQGFEVIMHNGLFDLSWLMYYCGMEFAPDIKVIDTMLLAHIKGERRLSLKHLSMMNGNFKGRRNTMDADESYLIEDMLTTELLWSKYQSAYETFSGRMVCEGVKTFAECKVNGVSIDTGKLFELRDEYKKLEENSPFDFNVNSNSELADYFIKNDVPLKSKTVSGSYSVSQIELKKIDHPLVDKYLEYKAGLSIYQKYVRPYTEMGLDTIRPDVLLWGTDTGRLSCRNPNVQQIPGRSNFKDIFRSRFKNGYIANIDLDRAELGIAALLSGDETYVEALTSQDFHKLVAAKTFEKDEKDVTYKERFIAKAVNFGGVLYGGSAKGIAARINVEPDVVASVQNWYKKEFPVLTKWIEEQKQIAVYTNAVTTFFGRKRLLDSYRRDQKERIGVNTSVQSVASDVMTFIVVQLSVLLRKHKAQSKIMFPVHDELLLDVHPDELELVVDLLRQSFKAVKKTPLGKLPLIDVLPISGELEYGDSWLYLKSDDYESKGSFYISSLE